VTAWLKIGTSFILKRNKTAAICKKKKDYGVRRRNHMGKNVDLWHRDAKVWLLVNGLNSEPLRIFVCESGRLLARSKGRKSSSLSPILQDCGGDAVIEKQSAKCTDDTSWWMTYTFGIVSSSVLRFQLIVLLLPDLPQCLLQRWNKLGQRPHRIRAKALFNILKCLIQDFNSASFCLE
jgi:hypothetical protein